MTLLLVVPAPIAALQVWDVADGSAQMNVLGEGALAFVLWLSLPAAFLTAWSVRPRGAAPWLAVAGAVATSLAGTLWIVRPTAPDGADYDVTYEVAMADLVADVTAALDDAVPGRWEGPDPEHLEPNRCVDKFDRDRGAAYGWVAIDIDGRVTETEFERFELAVRDPGREVQAPEFGRPEELLGQDHETFVVRIDEFFGDPNQWRVEIVTPCLKSESGGL